MRELTYAKAINEGIREEMRRDNQMVVMGEDVGKYGGIFGVTRGLFDEFGNLIGVTTLRSQNTVIAIEEFYQ